MKWRTAVAAAAVATLTACSTFGPTAKNAANTLSGRLSVQVAAHQDTPASSVTAAFDLRGGANQGELELLSPLGTVMAQAHWNAADVVLKSAGVERHFPDLPALANAVLGEPLPLAALFDWLRGKPWAGAPSQLLAAPDVGFEQLGWVVLLERHREGWVVAHRSAAPAVTLKAKLSQ